MYQLFLNIGTLKKLSTCLYSVSFEDKFKANLERGNAELEKRRLALQEAERREQERRAQKKREEQERREREAQEAEERRRKEEERRLERQRELEKQKEEERQREIERKEVGGILQLSVCTSMHFCMNVSSFYSRNVCSHLNAYIFTSVSFVSVSISGCTAGA